MASNRAKSSLIVGLESKGVVVTDDQLDIDPVSQADFVRLKDVAELEKFMEEPVKVLLMSTTDVNAPPYADLNVNGERCVIRRNTPTMIKRKHLEVLARMKETRVVQQIPDGHQGQITTDTLRGFTANCYPFTLLEDKNPKGAAWLEHILAEAA